MLPKKNRLTKEKDFENAFKKGRAFSGALVFLRIAKNELPFSRFGFLVGLKISKKAVERNRARRQLQEAARVNVKKIKNGFDITISAKAGIKGKNYKDIEKELLEIFKRAGILDS